MVHVWALHWSVFSQTVAALGENGDGNVEKEADLCNASIAPQEKTATQQHATNKNGKRWFK